MQFKTNFHYRILLNDELEKRRRRNPGYSLRAFARDLAVDAGNLSRILKRQAAISYRTANRLADRLRLSAPSRAAFLGSVLAEQSQKALSQTPATVWSGSSGGGTQFNWEKFVNREVGWHYMAILNLVCLEGAQSDPRWMAEMLGIPVQKARKAVRALSECGLLENVGGDWRRTAVTNPPPESIRGGTKDRRYQAIMLHKARLALLRRSESFARGTTIAVPAEYVPQIQEMVRQFVFTLRTYCDTLPHRRLYHCIVGFFPLQVDEPSRSGSRRTRAAGD